MLVDSLAILTMLVFDHFKKQKKLNIASSRAGNVIGGGDFKKDRIVPDVIKSLNHNKKIIMKELSFFI